MVILEALLLLSICLVECLAASPKWNLRSKHNNTNLYEDVPARQHIAVSCNEFVVESAKLVPQRYDLNLTFYKKFVNVSGLPVVGSYVVTDEALLLAATIVRIMSSKRPDLLHALIQDKVRVAIMAKSEKTSDIPEHHEFSNLNWARGLGATRWALASSGAEENILAWRDDHYRGDNIFVHELAHSFLGMKLDAPRYLTPQSDTKLKVAATNRFNAARSRGKWNRTYSATNQDEWFAVGAQVWFNVIREGPERGDGILNNINTPPKLYEYDRGLYDLLDLVFPKNSVIPDACQMPFSKVV